MIGLSNFLGALSRVGCLVEAEEGMTESTWAMLWPDVGGGVNE